MEQYRVLFPNARQILVRCQANVFWTREAIKVWNGLKYRMALKLMLSFR
jgi:hypothetical protein